METLPKASFAYKVGPISEESMITLSWLDAHGYDGGFKTFHDESELTDEGWFFYFTEPSAWSFNEEVTEDPDAFLACCGDPDLSQTLLNFCNQIV
jgi:hypothetical protein